MPYMLSTIHVEDFDAFRSDFESDPFGARKSAKGHRILRSVEDPNDVFIQVAFDSADDARAARRKLLDGGIHERVDVKAGPSVVEEAEQVSY